MMFCNLSVKFFFCYFFMILCITIDSVIPVKHLKIKAKLCNKRLFEDEFDVRDELQCHPQKLEKIKKCKANIYHSIPQRTKIPVTICKMIITRWTTYTYFFGAKTKETQTFDGLPPSVSDCINWAETRDAGVYGKFVGNPAKVLLTENRPTYIYTWPVGVSGQVINIAIIRSYVSYDHLNLQMISPITDVSNCNPNTGSCKTAPYTVVWNFKNVKDCPIKSVKSNATILLHNNSTGHLYRVEIKEMAISLHSWTDCGPLTRKCYNRKTFCIQNEFIVEPIDCTDLERLHFKHKINAPYLATAVGSLIQNSADKSAENIAHIHDKLNYLECNLERMLTMVYRTLAYTYPSQLLSAAIGRHVTAIKSGDTLMQLHCQSINATLLSSMIVNGTIYASRPIVKYIDALKIEKYGQIYPSGVVYEGIQFVESKLSNPVRTFRINSVYYRFVNYTLMDTNPNVKIVHPKLQTINAEIQPIDYLATVANYFTSTENVQSTDWDGILLSISEASKITDRIAHYTDTMSYDDDKMTYDPQKPLTDFRHTVKNSFFAILSSITSPFFNVILVIATILSLAWGIILTIYSIKLAIPFIKEFSMEIYKKHVRPRFNTHPTLEPEGSELVVESSERVPLDLTLQQREEPVRFTNSDSHSGVFILPRAGHRTPRT